MHDTLLPTALYASLKAAAIRLPLPKSPISPDDLPTSDELWHWSTRLTHASIAAGIAIGIALAFHALVFVALRRLARRSDAMADVVTVSRLNQPARWSLVAMAVSGAAESDRLVDHVWSAIAPFVVPALIGWVIYAVTMVVTNLMQVHVGLADAEVDTRRRRTRITILSRLAGFLIVLVTIALMMLGIPGVRHIGATLIASAGIMGLAVGAAAQPALKSLIAGIQIALTEPVRIDDVVVIDGETGRIEDIRLSYVVIRTPDERRVIVPTTKFLEASFQNWTRVGGITGHVVLPIKPGFEIAPIREVFLALLAKRPEWDGRTGKLQVTEARVGSVELRLMVSAADPSQLADLRFAMREAMLDWLRREMPDALCATT
ncbi:MAG: mechanosensitive ion channel family protein [Sphingomonadales bacterium]|nr:mechanosensitive ion channel family protein [Sphingomonadales bacterium]